jgi:hypothetical protein
VTDELAVIVAYMPTAVITIASSVVVLAAVRLAVALLRYRLEGKRIEMPSLYDASETRQLLEDAHRSLREMTSDKEALYSYVVAELNFLSTLTHWALAQKVAWVSGKGDTDDGWVIVIIASREPFRIKPNGMVVEHTEEGQRPAMFTVRNAPDTGIPYRSRGTQLAENAIGLGRLPGLCNHGHRVVFAIRFGDRELDVWIQTNSPTVMTRIPLSPEAYKGRGGTVDDEFDLSK